MDERTRVGLAVVATVGLFLAVQLGALALAPEFGAGGGGQVTDDPDDPTNSFLYVGVLLVATALMLAAIKLGAQGIIKGVILLTSGLLSWYVFGIVLPKALGGVLGAAAISWLALAGGIGVIVALLVHPEWYVIDAAGVVMGAGTAGLFGINFGVLPAIVLLVVLAVYDAISVYGTEHMLTLAEGVMDLNIPVVLVVPTTLSFSMADLRTPEPDEREEQSTTTGETTVDDGADAGPEPSEAATGSGDDGSAEGVLGRNALFIGLGDAVIPTVLVASGGFFLRSEAPSLVPGLALNLPALGGIVGTTVGLLGLLWLVVGGRAHAGLPLLNGGAIAGYVLGAAAAGIPVLRALGL